MIYTCEMMSFDVLAQKRALGVNSEQKLEAFLHK